MAGVCLTLASRTIEGRVAWRNPLIVQLEGGERVPLHRVLHVETAA